MTRYQHVKASGDLELDPCPSWRELLGFVVRLVSGVYLAVCLMEWLLQQ